MKESTHRRHCKNKSLSISTSSSEQFEEEELEEELEFVEFAEKEVFNHSIDHISSSQEESMLLILPETIK